MNIGRTSIEQPVLAIVLSIVLLIVGGLAYLVLPTSEYPDIAPPTVVVTATYPGASAQTVAETLAIPIEQEVNGVEDMLYMYSQATSDGSLNLTVTFKVALTSTRLRCWCRTAWRWPRRACRSRCNAVG